MSENTKKEKSTNSFVFYRSFYEAVKILPPDVRGEVYHAIMSNVFDGSYEEPSNPMIKSLMMLITPLIDTASQRYAESVENGKRGAASGKKGGRPKGSGAKNTNPQETPLVKNENPQETPLEENENPQETPYMYNDNYNDNDNDNYNDNSLSVFEAKEKEGFLEVFFFEKNMLDAVNEVERYVNHYEAVSWISNGNLIENRLAKSRTWEEEVKNRSEPRRFTREFLDKWKLIYDFVKSQNPSICKLFITALRRAHHQFNEEEKAIYLFVTCSKSLQEMLRKFWQEIDEAKIFHDSKYTVKIRTNVDPQS